MTDISPNVGIGGLRVIYPHVSRMYQATEAGHARYPAAEAVLQQLAPWYEPKAIDPTHLFGYWEILKHLWADGAHFLIVEHDIVIHDQVIPQLLDCPEPWCVFPYPGPNFPDLLTESLGCTRFRSVELPRDVLMEVSVMPDGIGATDWRRLDVNLGSRLKEHGFHPHLHYPCVVHHHRYIGKGCTCSEQHD